MSYSYSVLLVLIDKEYPHITPQDQQELVTIVYNAIQKPNAFLHTLRKSEGCGIQIRSRRHHHNHHRSRSSHQSEDQLMGLAKELISKYGILKYDASEHIKIYNLLCDIPTHIAKLYHQKVFYAHKDELNISTIKYILSHYLLQIYHVEGIDHPLIFNIAKYGWPKTRKSKDETNITMQEYIEYISQLYYGDVSHPKFWSKRPIRLSGKLL
jgi:hypothetical protein